MINTCSLGEVMDCKDLFESDSGGKVITLDIDGHYATGFLVCQMSDDDGINEKLHQRAVDLVKACNRMKEFDELVSVLRDIVGNRNPDVRGGLVKPSQLEAAWNVLDKAESA